MPEIVSYAADIMMIFASLGAACYCLVLSRRLSRLTSFDKGIGGAIAVLSAQVDDMKIALSEAKAGSEGAGGHLQDLVRQARDISGELELMIASCHDFAEEALVVQGQAPVASPLPAGDVPPPVGPRDHPVIAADTDAAGGSDHGADDTAGQDAPVLVFGTRRSAAAKPAFQRHDQVQV